MCQRDSRYHEKMTSRQHNLLQAALPSLTLFPSISHDCSFRLSFFILIPMLTYTPLPAMHFVTNLEGSGHTGCLPLHPVGVQTIYLYKKLLHFCIYTFEGPSPFCKTRVGPRTSCLFFAVKIPGGFLRFYCHGFGGSETHIVFLFFIHFPLYSSLPSLHHSHPTLCSEQQENLFFLFLEKAVSFISLIYGILSSYVFIFSIFMNILLNFNSVARCRVVTNFYNKFYLGSLNLVYFS